ncbi:rhamnogalacturonan lyase family protein [Maribellus maritimus]|uniref:rhamnogalacturonan lyase family protein n=1 Tax=Maribellus maritimus TaxID=2870838 RepID=UPI001EEB4ACC|nr:silent information regulator protein Sir2 [Maribellus maritimus]MCG6189866.1 silent information regulator protein Sir2 [Maribellus maritimus]
MKLSFFILFFVAVQFVFAQDPRERLYNYEVINPDHVEKPKVKGWAKTRFDEKLNRGLIAVRIEKNEAYIGWRILKKDAETVTFDLYKTVDGKKTKLSKDPIKSTTDFVDESVGSGKIILYSLEDSEGDVLAETELKAIENNVFKTIKFDGDYWPDRVAVGDLNGDGEYDFVIKQPGGRVDPGVWRKSDTTFKIEAYLSDGTFLWRKDLGWNIELGIWYSPMVVYDFDGDGKAEVALKTAPIDEDFRDAEGRVFDGPEYCSILDGMTGNEVCKVDWPARNPRFGKYNRNNRNQMGMAYLDGKTPFLLVARGTYRLMIVDAYQYKNKKLEKVWRWDGDEENPVIRSQGAHGMQTVDVDGDGRDEIALGSAVLDDNGTLLYSTGLGHPDKSFFTDIIPDRPGLEGFYAVEVWHDSLGVCIVDAKTGERIWAINKFTQHIGDGMVADIFPELPGLECMATEDSKAGRTDKYLLDAKGNIIAMNEDVPSPRDWIFWDEDLLRENIVSTPNPENSNRRFSRFKSIVKYHGKTHIDSIQGTVMMMADIYGDWREELITAVPGKLLIYTTTIPAKDKRNCLMQDPLYRSDVVHRSMGYFQSPVTSYYLGEK